MKHTLAGIVFACFTLTACKLPPTPPAPNETPEQAAERVEKDRAAQEVADQHTAKTIEETGAATGAMLPPPWNWLVIAGSNAAAYYIGRRSRKSETPAP